jgi:hypothetical protein
MKTILIGSLTSALVMGIFGFTASAEPLKNEVECLAISETAENMMVYRQTDGNTIGPMFRFIAEATNLGEYKELVKRIAIDAFQEPLWGSPEYKAKAVSNFSSDYFIECLEAYNGEL